MLTRLFHNITIPALVWALILSVALSLLGVWVVSSVQISAFQTSYTLNKTLAICLGVVALGFSAWLFSYHILKLAFLKPSYLPLFSVGSYLALFAGLYPDFSFILSAVLVAYCFGKLLHLSYSNTPSWLLTEVGIVAGLGTLLTTHFALFFIVMLVATVFYGAFHIRNILAPLIGYFITWFLFGGFSFLAYDTALLPQFNFGFHPFAELEFGKYPLVLAPIFLGLLLSAGDLISSLSKGKVNKRQSMGFMLAVMVLCLLAIGLIADAYFYALLLSFPLGIFQANFLLHQKKWWLRDLVLLAPAISLLILWLT